MPNSFNDPKPRMKRIIICCDGLSHTSSPERSIEFQNSDGGKLDVPTNVTRVAHALKSYTDDGVSQVAYYRSRVGTGSTVNRLVGGGTGLGLSEHVREAYGFLAHNYHPGDTIHLFGFSCGAYTARSICGLVCRIGILMKKGMDNFYQVYEDYRIKKYRNDPSAVAELQAREGGSLVTPNVKVKTICCWDTVGSLGIPSVGALVIGNWIAGIEQEKYGFHDTDLSPRVENASHALTLDEHRGPFTPTVWKKTEDIPTSLKQCWFPGVHANIGGGYDDQEIADMTLAWMVQQLLPFLQFDDDYLKIIIHNNDEHSSGELVGGNVRMPGGYGDSTEETIHKSVRLRMKVVPNRSSSALKGWTWYEGGFWEKGSKRIAEDELGSVEKRLAGKAVVKNMLGEDMS
ncbi:hypothetical protein L873DRAFT_1827826 [Choiromyces venosus 120613-1]|uniref:T6SS Phospholipase effector Tle1-like catalytic domain-containing protein n=1 Tax=Choiromyces venosus 120613-1 TaxID=1336337 RepID=A0A3N4JNV6_9PEZI|nr:hypothetical protein L873DRAFT_1827826 [Choiromyces venosus 120613-1]